MSEHYESCACLDMITGGSFNASRFLDIALAFLCPTMMRSQATMLAGHGVIERPSEVLR